MKKFTISLLFFYLIIINTSFAQNTFYLKCPQIITENKSEEHFYPSDELEDWVYNVGQKFNTNFAKIELSKSKATITPHHYSWMDSVELLNSKKSLGKPITTVLWYVEGDKKTFKVKKDENGQLVIDQSNKLMGLPTDKLNVMQKMIWIEKSNKWNFKEVLVIKFNNGDSGTARLKTEGECMNLSKKEYNNYLKNGEGTEFYNY